MANIICLETATNVCSVALSIDGLCTGFREANQENSHSSMLTVMIDELLREQNVSFGSIDAVAVGQGPGSYTGLRIGASVAKGICYSLDKPLVAISTLQSIAWGMRLEVGDSEKGALFCPMIDARRMEVYAAVYDVHMNIKMAETPVILDGASFSTFLKDTIVYLAGDGSEKSRPVISSGNARWLSTSASARWMTHLANEAFKNGIFQDVAYFSPTYLKEFSTTTPREKV